eukprot:gene11521-13443_t
MMQFLVDIDYNSAMIHLGVDFDDALATIQLYVTKVGVDSPTFRDGLLRLLGLVCLYGRMDILEYLLSVIKPDHLPESTHLEGAFTHGHMDIVHLLLAKRPERLGEQSWLHAAQSGNIEYFEFVKANSSNDLTYGALETANRHGRLDLVRHITTKYSKNVEMDGYNQLSSAETMLRSGYPSMLIDKVKRQQHLHLSDVAVLMIANQIVDPLSFQMIFSGYSHLFNVASLMTAVTGGNIVAVETIHRHLVKCDVAIPVARLLTEAFMCSHMTVIKYIVENMDLSRLVSPSDKEEPEQRLPTFYDIDRDTGMVSRSRLRKRHLDGYLYLRDRLTGAQLDVIFGKDPQVVVYLQSIALFDETFPKVAINTRASIKNHIYELVSPRIKLYSQKINMESKKKQDLAFLDYVEHVLRSCANNAKAADKVTEKRTRARSLTSNLTAEKEVLLTLLGIIDSIPGKPSLNPSYYISLIKWNDPDLTPYLLLTVGFDDICVYGNLSQVQEAHKLLGPKYRVTPYAWSGSDLEILKFLHANGMGTCDAERLHDEKDLEIVRFLVETQPSGSLTYLDSDMLANNRVAIAKYLRGQGGRCVNIDDNEDDYSVYVESLEMLEYLFEIGYDNSKILIEITETNGIAMVQLYANRLGADHPLFIRELPHLLRCACEMNLMKHVEFLISVAPSSTIDSSHLDAAFAYGHMDIVHLLLASRKERFSEKSWTIAAKSGSIELLEFVKDNAQIDLTFDALRNANRLGRLDLVRHITTKYPEQSRVADLDMTQCFIEDHADVFDYYICNFKKSIKVNSYNQLSSAETMLRSGYPSMLIDKVKRQQHLHLSDTAILFIANQIVDPLSFQMIFSGYSHLFNAASLMTAVTGGNIVAVETIHRHLVKCDVAIPVVRLLTEAFMCSHMTVIKYIVMNMDLSSLVAFCTEEVDQRPPTFYAQHSLEDTGMVSRSLLRKRHLDGYLYLRDRLTGAQLDVIFGKDPLIVVYLQSIALFDETFPKVDTEFIGPINVCINELIKRRIQIYNQETKIASKQKQDLAFLDFVEHVLKACANAKAVYKFTKKRTMVRSLTSNLTAEKEILLTLLDFIDEAQSKYICIIQWNDLDLTSYLLKTFGFDSICIHGTLEQVQAAYQLLGPPQDQMPCDGWKTSNLEILKFLHANGIGTCDANRLHHETNMEIVKFLVETHPIGWLTYYHSEMLASNQVAIIRYLRSQGDRCVNNDDENEVYGYSVYVESLEMLEYLFEIGYDNNRILLNITDTNDLAILQLYINRLGANHPTFIKLLPQLLESACHMSLLKHVEYLISVAPFSQIDSSHLDTAFAYGHMDIVHLLLAKRIERFSEKSWTIAAKSGSIELFEFVKDNAESDLIFDSLEYAIRYGRLDLARHITAKYPEQSRVADLNMTLCFLEDHADSVALFDETFPKVDTEPHGPIIECIHDLIKLTIQPYTGEIKKASKKQDLALLDYVEHVPKACPNGDNEKFATLYSRDCTAIKDILINPVTERVQLWRTHKHKVANF